MDCATALDRVFVARVDRKGHYLVQPIAIENEEVKACFGNKEGSTTCSITRTITDIPAMAAPYTDEYISNKRPMLLLLSPAGILALDLTSILPIIFLFSRKRNVGLRFRKGL